jgi:uncharacterized damage-inducible protein DinB
VKQILIKYSRYNHWANRLLFGLINSKADDQLLDREIKSSFPSLRKTVYHIWDAESIWLKRMNGDSPRTWPSRDFTGTFGEALDMIYENEQAIISFVESCSFGKLNESFDYTAIDGKAYTNAYWEAIQHCMNHNAYHRGQLVTMMRQSGIEELPSTDFIAYCRKTGNAVAG